MKKILSIAILALFLFSTMPLAEANPVPTLGGIRMANLNHTKEYNAKITKITKLEPKQDYNIRVTKIRNLDQIQEYNQAKEKYQETKEEWKIARQNYLKTKNSLNKIPIKNIGTLEGRENTESDITNIKAFLTKTVERMQNHVEILKKWTEMVVQDEELEKQILSQLEEDSKELENYKLKIENSSTVEELRNLGKELKDFWKETRLHLKKYHGIILPAKALSTIERSEDIYDKLYKKISTSSLGTVANLLPLLEEYKDLIASARESHEKAVAVYTSEGVSSNNLEDVKSNLRDAHSYLKEAHKKLRVIVKLYRDYTGDFPNPSLTEQTTSV